MNQRGDISPVVVFIILFALLAVIIISLFGEGLLPKAAEGVSYLIDKTLGGVKKDNQEKTQTTSEVSGIEQAFNDMLLVLRSEAAGPCILSRKTFPSDFQGFKITLSKSEQGIFLQLINKQRQTLNSKTINGRNPCVVAEGNAAENFYKAYLADNKCTNCFPDYSVADIEFQNSGNIYVNGNKRGLSDEGLVYKTKDGNVCFFPTYSGWFTSFGCDAAQEGLDDDCIQLIKQKIPVCK